MALFRRCDSRNLNLTPFCTLATATSSGALKWLPTINSTYGNATTAYTSSLAGPMRREYPTQNMAEDEIITHLAKVRNISNGGLTPSGWPCLQCLWKRCRCSEYLLWKVNCVWWVFLLIRIFNDLFSEYERSIKMTVFEFISNIGGLLGLCVGISFVSAIEIFYWFSVRLCRNFVTFSGWNKTKSQCK